ncbi:hypothetical protein ACMD2_10731 [Ananas comosus]|uniref:Uncharacterized protein n=1 Tax=Ananas comosus TaxID=4615 RepID=A0A199UJ84_ANACO|nr:hypothetical protein ACMD2_10731 [Ananas comosus]
MLQKFALAFKTKTIEFFAEEEEEEDDDDVASIRAVQDLLDPTPEAIITDQRVVVLKPDPNPNPNPSASAPDAGTLISAVFATLSSFHAAYLRLQTAHSPLLPDDLRSADADAVSHLRRLSDLRRLRLLSPNPNPNPNSAPDPTLSAHLEAQVRENQSLLRTFDAVINRLQADIDRKDGEAAELRRRLHDADAANAKLAARLDRACAPPPEENVEALLSVGVFDSVLRDACRITHRFAKVLVDLMKANGMDLSLAADSIHSGVNYAKPRHCRYAILSCICLGMFGGFDSYNFGCEESGIGFDDIDAKHRRIDSLRQFIEHSSADPFELISDDPSNDFSKFCKRKYQQLIHPGMESALFGTSECRESLWGALRPSNPLYESFVIMASSIWTLHRLAWAYDPVVEIFQVGRGTEFSMVYMENIVRKAIPANSKVGFTVVPGFRVGGTVIQCKVYLESVKKEV